MKPYAALLVFTAAVLTSACGTDKPATDTTPRTTTATVSTTVAAPPSEDTPPPATEPEQEQQEPTGEAVPVEGDTDGDGVPDGFVSGGTPEPVAEPAGLAEDCAAGTAAASTCSYWGYPFGTSAGQGKTIARCGDATMERGTTFYTDGTSGWTQECADQMGH